MLTASHLLSLELCRMLKFVYFLSIPQSWPTFCWCSLAVRKGSLSQPSEVCTGNQPWSESENEVPKGLEVPVGQLQGESIAGHSQWLMHSLSDVCGSGVSRIWVLLMLSESPDCYSGLLSHPAAPLQSALWIPGFHICKFNQLHTENSIFNPQLGIHTCRELTWFIYGFSTAGEWERVSVPQPQCCSKVDCTLNTIITDVLITSLWYKG